MLLRSAVSNKNCQRTIAENRTGRAKKAVGRAGNQGYQRAQTGDGHRFFDTRPTGCKTGLYLDLEIPSAAGLPDV